MISLYNKQGKHRRIAKFKTWSIAAKWCMDRWEGNISEEENQKYFLKKTKS